MTTVPVIDLYQEWKRFTEEEGAAILASDWAAVEQAQFSKKQLQAEILRAAERIAPSSQAEADPVIREHLRELIELETRNHATLEKCLQSAGREKQNLDRTSVRLRQIHKSYVPQQGAAWNQYS
jgi:hypothetical protein